MIVTTEAIVLSGMKYGDTSKIVRLYTREFGKVSVLAKGARSAKNKFRSALEPMSHVSAVIYKHDNRELHLLSQCDLLESYRALTDDMAKMYVGMSVLELVSVVAHEEEQNEQLFHLLLSTLIAANSATFTGFLPLYYFELKLAELLGFRPEFSVCSECGKTLASSEGTRKVMVGNSGALCPDCEGFHARTAAISVGTLRVLQRLHEVESLAGARNLKIGGPVEEELRRTLSNHLRNHIEGFRGLRTEEVFAEIL